MTKMPAKIPLEIAKRIKELEPQVKNLDLYAIMELELLDEADFLVTEFADICREKALEQSRLIKADFSTLYAQCIDKASKELESVLRDHVHRVYFSADILFSKFYDYSIPEEIGEKYYARAREIIRDALKRFKECAQKPQLQAISTS